MKKIKIVPLIIMIVILIFLFNPQMIPFIPSDAKNKIASAMASTFKNVGSEASGINWLTLIKMAAVYCILSAIAIILDFVIASGRKSTGRRKTISTVLISLVKYTKFIVLIIWWLSILGVNTAAIFASLGIVSLVIGFGAQSLVEDIITGIFIIFEGQYNVDDVIVIDGFRGTVLSIGVRTTRIMDAGGNVKIINNSDIRNVQNRSVRLSTAICDISIAYNEKIRNAENVFEKVFPVIKEKYKNIIVEGPVYLGVQELAESAVVLRVIAKTNEEDIFTAQRILNKELKNAFDENNIDIPFPQIVVHNGENSNDKELTDEELKRVAQFLSEQTQLKKELNINQ